jgi:hypothetical protein
MKKNILPWTLSIAASLILSIGLQAQEQTEVSIKVKKDGKLIKDTTYQFDDPSEARHAIKMMEIISGDEEHMEEIHYNYTTAHSGSGHSKAMVFISEDGETTEITEFHGDSMVWVSDGEDMHVHSKKVIVMKSEDGNTFDIMVDEDMLEKDEDVYVIKGDDNIKVEMKKIMKEHDGEEGSNVKVIVIKDSGDIHQEHDSDHDQDSDRDEDVDEDVEVTVIKKEKKQKK